MSTIPLPPPGGAPGKKLPVTRWVAPPPPRNAPAKNAYPLPVMEFGWQYWFNYFYNEVPGERQLPFFEEISPSQGVYISTDVDLPVASKTRLLSTMMNIGFKAYPDASRLGADAMYLTMKRMGKPDPLMVMFRGDGRLPQMIATNQGTRPQTQVRLANRNFEMPWHPWKDQTLAGKVWYRKGFNGDNCLFSAISVTPKFKIATKFPLLGEPGNQVKSAKVKIIPGGMPRPNATFAEKKSFFDTQRTLLCSPTNVYVVAVTGGFNTQAMQLSEHNATFNERASNDLTYAQHYAMISVVRVHYTQDPNDGHVIVVLKTELLQSEQHLRAALGDAGFLSLKAYLAKLAKEGTMLGLGIHYHPNKEPPPIKIEKFETFPTFA